MEVCKSKEIGSTIQPAEEFLLPTVENVTLTKKVYDMGVFLGQKNLPTFRMLINQFFKKQKRLCHLQTYTKNLLEKMQKD